MSLERPQELIVVLLKVSLEVENTNIEDCGYSGRKLDFIFMGLSLVIMREEKHRKHTMCYDSRSFLMEYFSIFSKQHES